MSGITRSLENSIAGIPKKFRRAKLVYSEKKAIRRKAPLYADVQWTAEQTADMNAFWKEHYGMTITPRWHKLYQSMNGVYQKAYFPEMLYTTELEPLINPDEYCRFFNDKSIIEFLYGEADPVRYPTTRLVRCNGTFCDGSRKLMTYDQAVALFGDLGDCVIKPTVETGSGKGVAVLRMKNGKDEKSGKSAKEIIDEHGKDFIVQEKLKNHERFSAIYSGSINTIRLITYLVEGDVHHVPLVMRIGVGGHEVDNIHMGGLCIGVTDEGRLKKKAYQLGYGDTAITYEKHPDTGIVFEGYFIGDIPRMIEAAKTLHRRTPHVGMISWDFTIDQDENIVLIEANCKDQSIWFPQIVNECAFFGDDTPYMLHKIAGRRKL